MMRDVFVAEKLSEEAKDMKAIQARSGIQRRRNLVTDLPDMIPDIIEVKRNGKWLSPLPILGFQVLRGVKTITLALPPFGSELKARQRLKLPR